MLRKIFTVVVVSIFLGLVNTNSQPEKSEQQSPDQSMPTRYENFLKRTDAVIVTQSYPVAGLLGGSGARMTAKVAWVLDETNKVYAVETGMRIVDFEQLKGIQDGLDKISQAINSSFEKLNATSMSYSSQAGLFVSYYTYTDSSKKPKTNLYLTVGSHTTQSPGIEPLVEMRSLVAQAREKLISLGAK